MRDKTKLKFIAIEGPDGCGKSTQIALLKKRLSSLGKRVKCLHFPRYDCPVYGELIAKFLRGEFGKVQDVSPYLVALLYAGDRRDAAPTIIEWLASGYYVVVDRYVYSNIAFQAAKVDNEKEKAILASWIGDLEFGYYGIPRPGVSILLNVPISFLKRQLGTARKGADRGYLQGCEDIHENSLGLQEKVLAEYLKLTEISPDFQRVECCHVTGRMLAPEEIHTQLWAVLEQAERS